MWEISFRRKNLISRKNRAVTVRRRDSFEEFMSRKLVSEIICQSSSRCMAARLSSAQPFEKRRCQVGREETFNAGTNVHMYVIRRRNEVRAIGGATVASKKRHRNCERYGETTTKQI